MDPHLIALSIPLFLTLIAVEWVGARRLGLDVYHFQDSLANLTTGIAQQATDGFVSLWAVLSYGAIYNHLRMWDIPMSSPLQWLVVALSVDLLYYWFHRASHRVNLLWAAHAVHHQSEDYNLTTALRQSILQPAYNAVFFWPLALLGVPPSAVALLFTANLLYQFWIHTQLIGTLGPLERWLSTPANHRVHHGIDPEYLDRNYGGVLMVWDRLFGTFQPELHPPTFGTVKPLRSWNPLWANLAHYPTILERSRASQGLLERLWAWIAPPEWRPAALGGPLPARPVDPGRERYRVCASKRLRAYVGAQCVLTIVALIGAATQSAHWTMPQQGLAGGWFLASVAALTGLLEGRRWSLPLELFRLAAGVALCVGLL